MPRAESPFRVLEKVNDNTYKINLLENYSVNPMFNMCDLTPYLEDRVGAKDNVDLRANPFKKGRYDVPHHERFDPTNPREEEPEFEKTMVSYRGPITRSRAKFINITHLDNKAAYEGDWKFLRRNKRFKISQLA